MLRPGEGQRSPAGHEEVAQEPGGLIVWVEAVSPGVLEPQNHRRLTDPAARGGGGWLSEWAFPSVPRVFGPSFAFARGLQLWEVR